jgi:acyl dehydratase
MRELTRHFRQREQRIVSRRIQIENRGDGKRVYCFSSHRRTITETDIVNFVNLVGLHEPPFIDMEWVEKQMPGRHNRRFAPAPFLISLGMGLVATSAMDVIDAISEDHGLGQFHGMVGLRAKVQNPAFPGDTLSVDLGAWVDRTTERGQTLVDLEHVVKNQRGETIVVFTEKLIFDRASE